MTEILTSRGRPLAAKLGVKLQDISAVLYRDMQKFLEKTAVTSANKGSSFADFCRTWPLRIVSKSYLIEQVLRFFLPPERDRLEQAGYRLVSLATDCLVAETPNQLLFRRNRPLAGGP